MIQEFDRFGRYIEDSCFGCELERCDWCPRGNASMGGE